MNPAVVTTIVVAIAVAVGIAGLWPMFKRGYRGAIGFKNRFPSEIATLTLTGFPRPIECRTLARGEHSFNYPGPQPIPDAVAITWRFVGDAADRTASVSMAGVRKDVKDGELFFALLSDGTWAVEYAPQLQLDKLQRGE